MPNPTGRSLNINEATAKRWLAMRNDGLSFKDIAKAEGVADMTVRRHLARLFADRWAVGQPAPLAWKPVVQPEWNPMRDVLFRDVLKRCEEYRAIPSLFE